MKTTKTAILLVWVNVRKRQMVALGNTSLKICKYFNTKNRLKNLRRFFLYLLLKNYKIFHYESKILSFSEPMD